MVVVVIILKHNGLCGQAISTSQLCSQSIIGTNFCAHVMLFGCILHACNLWGQHFIFFLCSLCKTVALNSNITLKQLAFTKNLYLATNNYHYREVNFSKTSKWKADILNNFVFPKVPNTDLIAYVYWFFVSQVPSNKCIAPYCPQSSLGGCHPTIRG